MNGFDMAVLMMLALVIAFEFGHNIGSRPVRTRKDTRESRQPIHR